MLKWMQHVKKPGNHPEHYAKSAEDLGNSTITSAECKEKVTNFCHTTVTLGNVFLNSPRNRSLYYVK